MLFKCLSGTQQESQKEIGKTLKYLRSNRGGEFTSNEFEMFHNDRGIKR